MTLNPQTILPAVIDAATFAGRMVAHEFARPDGPRLIDHVTAPVDHEIELFLRDRLMTLVPARFVGEEAGIVAAEPNGLCWVVDPHDGTRAFLEGKRGSAVSIALLRRGQPVLAVVFAPLCPDRGPDMIAWAEGGPITRNGEPVAIDLRRRTLQAGDVVFLNHGVWQRPVWNTIACAPAGFMPLPSIAYRLARIAVGDGIATQTLRPVNALDIAAGHALLLAAGGVLVAEDGQPVTYSELGESRPSACFGGAPEVVTALLTRAWRGSTEPRREPRILLDWPRVAEGPAFDRAVGCLLGLVIGGSLDPGRGNPDAVPKPADAGQPGPLSGSPEPAVALARMLVGRDSYDPEAAAAAYGAWIASGPATPPPGSARAFAAIAATTGSRAEAARAAADPLDRGDDALVRAVPLGLWAANPRQAAAAALADAALSHPHPDCLAGAAAIAAAIAAGVDGADPAGMAAAALDAARGVAGGDAAVEALAGAPPPLTPHPSSALLTLGFAFRHLAAGTDARIALDSARSAIERAVTGALLGAAKGRLAMPTPWVMRALTNRPDAGLFESGLAVPHPRPDIYWTDDLVDLAEALLTSRTAANTPLSGGTAPGGPPGSTMREPR